MEPSFRRKLKLVLKPKPMPKIKLSLRTSTQNIHHGESHTLKQYDQMTETEKGNYMVNWIIDILYTFNIFTEIINTSNVSSHIYDIVIRSKFDDVLRGLQVKTLIDSKNKYDQWFIHTDNCAYLPETLIIMSNHNKTRFALAFWKEISHLTNRLKLTFSQNSKSYNHIKFTDIESFKKQLFELSQKSVVIDKIETGIISETHLKEYKSILEIKKVCEKKNIEFKYDLYGGSVDIYLNGFSTQCKFSSYATSSNGFYRFSIHRGIKKSPYKQSDNIDCFVFQVHDNNDPNKYINDICIVPIKYLIEHGFIQTNNCKGKTSIYIPPPDCPQLSWLMPFWNNFNIFYGVNEIMDPIHNFSRKYFCLFRNTSIKNSNSYVVKLTEYDKKIKFDYMIINVFNRKENVKIFKDHIFVISKQNLIELGYFKYECGQSLCIKTPNYDKEDWSLKYWKRIGELNDM